MTSIKFSPIFTTNRFSGFCYSPISLFMSLLLNKPQWAGPVNDESHGHMWISLLPPESHSQPLVVHCKIQGGMWVWGYSTVLWLRRRSSSPLWCRSPCCSYKPPRLQNCSLIQSHSRSWCGVALRSARGCTGWTWGKDSTAHLSDIQSLLRCSARNPPCIWSSQLSLRQILLCSQIPRCCRKQQGVFHKNELYNGAWPDLRGEPTCPGHCRGAGSCLPGCNRLNNSRMQCLQITDGQSLERHVPHWGARHRRQPDTAGRFCSTCHWPGTQWCQDRQGCSYEMREKGTVTKHIIWEKVFASSYSAFIF